MNSLERRIINLCIEGKKSEHGLRYTDVAKQIERETGMALHPEAIRNVSRKYRVQNNLDENFRPASHDGVETPESISYNTDGSMTKQIQFSVSKGTEITPELLLKEHGFDKDVFELVSAKNTKWNAQQKGGHIVDMYSSKITVRPRKEFSWSQENIDKIFESVNIEPKEPSAGHNLIASDKLLVVPISDLHLGLLSEYNVTGNDYNMEIAEKLYYDTLYDIIEEVKGKDFCKVLFILGNDFLNSDNINNTTTRGIQQDSSNMWHTLIDKATEMCIKGIDLLAGIAPVDVVYAVSNHDYHSMYGIMNVLRAYYRNCDNISIIGDARERKYYRFGEVLIGVAHDIKPDRALELMSVEAHDDWSECKSMIWFLGHLHSQMAYSKKGYVETLRLPTISGWSRWSNQQGFTQTEHKNQAFIIDAHTGIKTTINTVFKI